MIESLIYEIEELLKTSDNNIWSKRFNTFWGYYRADNNIFALASSLFILQELHNKFDLTIKESLQKNIETEIKHFDKYLNKENFSCYNFYPTSTSQHFSNGWFMHRLKHFKLPDDIDDSAVIYYVLNKNKEEILTLRNLCETHKSEVFLKSINKNVDIYSTWFGKNMPKDHDVCALLNLMTLFANGKLEHTETDKNTILYLAEKISEIEKNPFWISRHYGQSALIIYHYARFMSHSNFLEPYKSEIIAIAKALKRQKNHSSFKILLEIALLKLGVKTNISTLDFPNKKFYSFIGAPLAPFKLFKPLASWSIFHIFWKSELHEVVLRLEYEVNKNYLCYKGMK